MLIIVKPEQIKQAEQFSTDCVPTTNYAIRGQRNNTKIKNDIFVGKLGEWAVYNALKPHFPDLKEPDHNIYKGRKKSHGADLETEDGAYKFAIKTQSMDSLEKYGNSYLLEKDSVAKFKNQLFVVCIHLGEGRILINGLFTFAEFTENPGEPKLAWLRSKAAFYVEDILVSKIKQNKLIVD